MTSIRPLMERNFLEYASYVIVDRAIPDLRDGCKPVQRRILATLFDMHDGRFHKVANVIGETMKLHPHGDASISDALVVLANKEYFIERQGNFGNLLTGHPPAAARYIECRLTDLAVETLFNKKLTKTQPSYDGRRQEPLYLPAKLPVVLLLGTEGIAVGMSTRILPHNFCELLDAQIAILRNQDFEILPDFAQGGFVDASEYDDGRGRVRVRAKIDVAKDQKSLTVREIPFSTTTESLIQSIENAAQKKKLKVSAIEDRTGETVEIVIHLPRGVYADEVEPQLYAYTQCEASIIPNLIVIEDGHPVELTVSEVLRRLTKHLREQVRAELQLELDELEDRRHYATLEQIFIEKRVYKRIEEAKTAEAVRREVVDGMEEHRELFVRDLTDEDVTRLLEIRIRRISAYDIEKNRKELDEIAKGIRGAKRRLKELTKTTIGYLESLRAKYGDRFPRRSELCSFEEVSKKEVARETLKLAYDPSTGLFGTAVRGKKFEITCSEFAKIFILNAEGHYRVIAPPEKEFVGKDVLLAEVFDDEEGLVVTLIYRDEDRIAWGKKMHVKAFIKDKEYPCIKDGKIDRAYLGEVDQVVRLKYVPAKYQRINEETFDLRELDFSGVSARGRKMGSKPVSRFALEEPEG